MLGGWHLSLYQLFMRLRGSFRPRNDMNCLHSFGGQRLLSFSISPRALVGTLVLNFCRFLVIARGSVTELDTLLLLAEKLNYITALQTDEALATLDHITALVNGLIRKHSGAKS